MIVRLPLLPRQRQRVAMYGNHSTGWLAGSAVCVVGWLGYVPHACHTQPRGRHPGVCGCPANDTRGTVPLDERASCRNRTKRHGRFPSRLTRCALSLALLHYWSPTVSVGSTNTS